MTACTGCWGTAEEEVEDFSSSKKGLVPCRIRWIYSTHRDNGEKQRRGPQVSLLNMPLHSCECCWKRLSVLVVKNNKASNPAQSILILPLPLIAQRQNNDKFHNIFLVQESKIKCQSYFVLRYFQRRSANPFCPLAKWSLQADTGVNFPPARRGHRHNCYQIVRKPAWCSAPGNCGRICS